MIKYGNVMSLEDNYDLSRNNVNSIVQKLLKKEALGYSRVFGKKPGWLSLLW